MKVFTYKDSMKRKLSYFWRKVLTPFVCIKNYFFCLRFPFMRSYNVWDHTYTGYRFTWYDDISRGWQKAFGKKMLKEIKAKLKEMKVKRKDWSELVAWEQIKSKYGSLRLYAGAPDEINKILSKYEVMSTGYCEYCGKPARYVTTGWIAFVCEDCKEEDSIRLTLGNIPHGIQYKYEDIGKEEVFDTAEARDKRYEKLWEKYRGTDTRFETSKRDDKFIIKYKKMIKEEIDYKEKYGIDFKKLWGLE